MSHFSISKYFKLRDNGQRQCLHCENKTYKTTDDEVLRKHILTKHSAIINTPPVPGTRSLFDSSGDPQVRTSSSAVRQPTLPMPVPSELPTLKQFLEDNGLGKYYENFIDEQCDDSHVSDLLRCNNDELTEFASFGKLSRLDVIRFKKGVRQLKESRNPQASPPSLTPSLTDAPSHLRHLRLLQHCQRPSTVSLRYCPHQGSPTKKRCLDGTLGLRGAIEAAGLTEKATANGKITLSNFTMKERVTELEYLGDDPAPGDPFEKLFETARQLKASGKFPDNGGFISTTSSTTPTANDALPVVETSKLYNPGQQRDLRCRVLCNMGSQLFKCFLLSWILSAPDLGFLSPA